MGCGGSKKDVTKPNIVAPPQEDHYQNPRGYVSKSQPVMTNASSATMGETEDRIIEFDFDINKEVFGKRRDKHGNLVPIYHRDIPLYQALEEDEENESSHHTFSQTTILEEAARQESGVLYRDDAAPVSLEIEYVYGYRCFDSRQNLFYTNQPNNIVFITAALGIVQDVSNNRQQYFGGWNQKVNRGHNDDITAIAIASQRDIVATGQVGVNPKICIWKVDNPNDKPLKTFRIGQDKTAITALSFSFDAKYLAVTDMSLKNWVSLWDVATGLKIADQQTGTAKLLDVQWGPNDYKFCTVGIHHTWFWDYNEKVLKNNRARFGTIGRVCNMTSINWLPSGFCLTGGTNGQIYIWTDGKLKETHQIHERNEAVHSLCVKDDFILSGGNDNTIRVLNFDFEEINRISVRDCPRGLDYQNGIILCGTRDGGILEIDVTSQTTREILESHFDGEVWGLAHQNGKIFTSGDDNSIRTWDIALHKMISLSEVNEDKSPLRVQTGNENIVTSTSLIEQSRALAINPRNGHFAVAHNNGLVTIRQSVQKVQQVLYRLVDSQDWSECLQYSPDGTRLAIGSHDRGIYVYDVENQYALLFGLVHHRSYVMALDWSSDGLFIRSCGNEGEIVYWDVENQQPLSSCPQTQWSLFSCKFGDQVKGIFRGVDNPSFVNRVSVSPCGSMIAVGNDWGTLDIFGFPNSEKAQCVSFKAHSAQVTNVIWIGDRIFTTGGFDQSLIQWRVLRNN